MAKKLTKEIFEKVLENRGLSPLEKLIGKKFITSYQDELGAGLTAGVIQGVDISRNPDHKGAYFISLYVSAPRLASNNKSNEIIDCIWSTGSMYKNSRQNKGGWTIFTQPERNFPLKGELQILD